MSSSDKSTKKKPSNKTEELENLEENEPLYKTEELKQTEENTGKSDKKKKSSNKKTKEKKEENVHAGHRDRLRSRLLKEGGSSFEKHQLLELLLFNPVSRRDTNPMAHKLLNNFNNSFTMLINSDYQDIMKKAKVNEDVAAFIKALEEFVKVCQKEKNEPKLNLDNVEKLGKYAVNMLMHETTEKFLILCADARLNLIKTIEIATGSQSRVQIDGPEVVKEALLCKATSVAFVHNHPAGTLKASKADIHLTLELKRMLASVNIKVTDHIIVANDKYMSFASEGLL